MSDQPLRLVLGTANLGDDELASRLLDQFYEAGGRAIDLANVYGEGASARTVGAWLRARGRRDDVELYAKGCHPPYCDPAFVSNEVERALACLDANRLDAFLLHRDDPAIPVQSWAEALMEELHRGTVNQVGVSNWTPERFLALREQFSEAAADRLSYFSNHFSLAEMAEPTWPGCLAIDAETARSLAASGITVLAWASLAGGYLGDRESSDPAVQRSWGTDQNQRRRKRAVELAELLGTATATVAVAYVLAHDGVRPVIGTRSGAHLAEALAAETVNLSHAQVAQLEAGTPT
jgi:aryl-alcohol dehydrogenase-like predicted oxidoreductase